MDTINLVFKLVNNLKYYLEIDGVMVFPEKNQSKYCLFQIDSPLTLIVTQARTGAYLQMAPGTSMPTGELKTRKQRYLQNLGL